MEATMRRPYLPAIAGLAALGTFASASAFEFPDTAVVVASNPVFERVSVPQQQCWNEAVTVNEYHVDPAPRAEHSAVGAVIGGVAGGILGNQIGEGSGRTAATAIGAATGALVGDRLASQAQPGDYIVAEPRTQLVERCRTVEAMRDEVRGYDVTYRYNGREFTTRMPYDPGPRVSVAVSVTPAVPSVTAAR
jgi:uncharacterized protein YcfJ